MNPQDDPEARIRALEPTEFGTSHASPPTPPLPPPTQQWPYPPPHDQNRYGQTAYGQSPYGAEPYNTGYMAPYPTSPPASGSGFRPWLLIVPMVALLLLIGGGVAVYWMYSNAANTAGIPGISGGGGQISTAPAIPEMPVLPDLPPIITDSTGGVNPPPNGIPEAGSTVTVTGVASNRTISCNDTVLIITGANNTIEVTGHCMAITVSGFENIVTAESAGEITVSGFQNRITYRSGSPAINQSGGDNTIEQG